MGNREKVVSANHLVSLFLWSVMGVYLQLGFVRLFTTMNGAFAYYGNILLLVAIFSTSAGFFSKRMQRWSILVPLLLLLTYWVGLYLNNHNLMQEMEFEYQWFNAANITPKPFNLDLQVGCVIAFLCIAPTCYLVGCGEKAALVKSGAGPVGYLTMGIGGILGGLVFLAQNQYLSGHFSLWLIGSILLLAAFGSQLKKVWLLGVTTVPLLVLVQQAYEFSSEHLWSPYQRIDLQQMDDYTMVVYANDFFIMGSFLVGADDVPEVLRNDFSKALTAIEPGDDVLIFGSGAGTYDVRESLYRGARSVTAVEIDPMFPEVGNQTDPDQTYLDDRVALHVNDARRFVNSTDQKYDVIFANFLDSQTNASNQARFRLDSFLYTREGFEQITNLLNDDGVFVMNFSTGTAWILVRMFESLEAAVGQDRVDVFQVKEGNIQHLYVYSNNPAKSFRPEGYRDSTELIRGSRLGVLSTDDWPFLYSLNRTVPQEHIRLLIIVCLFMLGLFLLATRSSQSSAGIDRKYGPLLVYSFLSGAAFFYIELRSISVLTPILGSTYVAQSVVISVIISLSMIGSMVALKWELPKFLAWGMLGVCLIVSALAEDLFHPFSGMLPSEILFVGANLIPILAAGVVFMCYVRNVTDTAIIAAVQRWNLIGGVIGGLFECMVILTGFKFSVFVGILFYFLGFLAIYLGPRIKLKLPSTDQTAPA